MNTAHSYTEAGEYNPKKDKMEKENIYVDLSKCSEDEQEHIFSLLPEEDAEKQYEIFGLFKYLHYDEITEYWFVDVGGIICNKTELTYHEFIKLFDGGEGEKKSRVEMMTDEQLQEALRVETAELESLQDSVSRIENEIFYRKNPDLRT